MGHFAILSAEYDPTSRNKRNRMRKLTGKRRVKAHRKRLIKSLNVLFHPTLKKTPIINTKYKEPENPKSSLTNQYMTTFDKINESMTLDKLRDYVEILYHDQNVIAINKLPGILTARSNDNTLDMQNILKSYIGKHREFRDWKKFLVKSIFDKFTKMEPFIAVLHRLDKSTSGVTIYGRHEEAAKSMIDLFAQRKVKKTYIAVIKGIAPKKSDDLIHYIATTKFPKVRIMNVEQFKLLNTDLNEENVETKEDGLEIEEASVVGMKKDSDKLKWKLS